MKEFDLNIEKVLENWTVAQAIREIIANALDEQLLSGSSDIQIFKDKEDKWHIRDFGRGLRYLHLTQNENEEKLIHPHLIGKFGVGLKDALATFDRHHVSVCIDSMYGHFTIGQSVKHGFNDITTLHAYIEEPKDSSFAGTDFCITGCSDSDIETAKRNFLCFSGMRCLEHTDNGEIYEPRNGLSEIFINGVKVAEEEHFLFSYNITSLTSSIKKALNRERTNVGRSAYSDRVKTILLSASSETVIIRLSNNLTKMSSGTQCDEIKWTDVQAHVVKLLHARANTVFVTPKEIETVSGNAMEAVQESGKTIVYVPENVMKKVEGTTDAKGNKISTIKTVVEARNKSFQYSFINYDALTPEEKAVFDCTADVMKLVDAKIPLDRIFISENLRIDDSGDTLGVYERINDRIIIRRSQLENRAKYVGTLIHEITHADTGFSDYSRSFESCLTDHIGRFADEIISNRQEILKLKEATMHACNSTEKTSTNEKTIIVVHYSLDHLDELTLDELKALQEKASEAHALEDDVAICSEILRRKEDPNYYKERAVSYFILGYSDLAFEDINAAIRIDSEQAQYYRQKALFYCKLSNDALAIETLQKALYLAPETEDIIKCACDIYLHAEMYTESVRYAQQFITLFPDSSLAYKKLFTAYLKNGDYSESLDTVNFAIDKFDDDGRFHYYKALLSNCDCVSKKTALAEAQKALECEPSNKDYLLLKTVLELSAHMSTNISFPL